MLLKQRTQHAVSLTQLIIVLYRRRVSGHSFEMLYGPTEFVERLFGTAACIRGLRAVQLDQRAQALGARIVLEPIQQIEALLICTQSAADVAQVGAKHVALDVAQT